MLPQSHFQPSEINLIVVFSDHRIRSLVSQVPDYIPTGQKTVTINLIQPDNNGFNAFLSVPNFSKSNKPEQS
ncbi:hypothetical protein GCM10027185_34420 [Spirosoma pulveris]